MEDDVNRFIEAQDGGQYEKALAEIVQGCKQSHWVWYIFPQMRVRRRRVIIITLCRIGCGTYFRRCADLVTAECRVITV